MMDTMTAAALSDGIESRMSDMIPSTSQSEATATRRIGVREEGEQGKHDQTSRDHR